MKLEQLAKRPVTLSKEMYDQAIRKLMLCGTSAAFLVACVIIY